MADNTRGVHFVGRLGTYKYYNMDQVVGQALATFDKLNGSRTERIVVPAAAPVASVKAATNGAPQPV